MSTPFQILGTTETPSAIENLINQAKTHLYLVTPYFKPSERVGKAILTAKVVRKANVVMILRGGDDRAKQAANAKPFVEAGVVVAYLSRLHAKLYVNEEEAILTSMNLYEESATNSYEVGVRYPKATSLEAFQAIVGQIQELAHRADEETQLAQASRAATAPASRTPATLRAPAPAPKARLARAAPAGHCIRCDVAVPLDVERPFCATCFATWSRFANVDYEEGTCHACGKDAKVTAGKPLCKSCWRASA